MALLVGQQPYFASLYNRLAHYDDKLVLQPELAEKWIFSADGKSLSLKLREGVKFHTGREFTSADVKSTIEFAQTNEKVSMRTMYQLIKKVETPEKYVVNLGFDGITPSANDILDTLYIIDIQSVADLPKYGVGTGPFKVDKYIPNDRVEYAAFKDYWDRGKPYIDRWVQRVIPDAAALSINLESGELDCAWRLSNQDALRLRDQGGKYAVSTGTPGYGMFDFCLRVDLDPFTNKKVRQAFALSIDRSRFCKTILQGLVQPTTLMWATHSWAYFKDLEGKNDFNLDKAKALLAEAGLANGFEVEMITASKRTFGLGPMAEIVQADLAKIGIKVKLSDLETTVYDNRMNKGDFVTMAHAYGRANRDPGSMLTGAKPWMNGFKEGNWTHYESAEWAKLREQLNSTLDMEKRKGTARQIQEMALDECFTIPVAPAVPIFAYKTYVKNFAVNMENSMLLGEIWLDK